MVLSSGILEMGLSLMTSQSSLSILNQSQWSMVLRIEKGLTSTRQKNPEDKLSTLKSYRRAKGLCFKYGEKWSHGHKCPPTISLHAIEEAWQFLHENNPEQHTTDCEDQDSGDDPMALSVQALPDYKIQSFLAGKEVFMLLDSRSSHCFIDQQTTDRLDGWQTLDQPIKVRMANGNEIPCTHELPNTIWGLQGHSFQSSFKVIPLGCYDIILGIDWLAKHSPMQIHWAKKWLQFNLQGHTIQLQGIQSGTTWGSPISAKPAPSYAKKRGYSIYGVD